MMMVLSMGDNLSCFALAGELFHAYIQYLGVWDHLYKREADPSFRFEMCEAEY